MAIYNQKRIRCSYQNQKGEKSTREMDPLRIDPRDSSWQLRAWCHNNEEPRNFRIDSMSNVEVLDTDWIPQSHKVEIDEELEYRAKETDVEVVIEADPEGLALISDFAGKVNKIDKKTGVTTATLQIGFLPYFGRAVARFGGAVRVISPAQAREVVREYALRALGQAGDRKDVE
jgi:proteasome accessory factor C